MDLRLSRHPYDSEYSYRGRLMCTVNHQIKLGVNTAEALGIGILLIEKYLHPTQLASMSMLANCVLSLSEL